MNALGSLLALLGALVFVLLCLAGWVRFLRDVFIPAVNHATVRMAMLSAELRYQARLRQEELAKLKGRLS